MMLRRYHPRPEDSPDDEDEQQPAEDEQDDGPPAETPTARSAARGKRG